MDFGGPKSFHMDFCQGETFHWCNVSIVAQNINSPDWRCYLFSFSLRELSGALERNIPDSWGSSKKFKPIYEKCICVREGRWSTSLESSDTYNNVFLALGDNWQRSTSSELVCTDSVKRRLFFKFNYFLVVTVCKNKNLLRFLFVWYSPPFLSFVMIWK